jgi:hypothetical protein
MTVMKGILKTLFILALAPAVLAQTSGSDSVSDLPNNFSIVFNSDVDIKPHYTALAIIGDPLKREAQCGLYFSESVDERIIPRGTKINFETAGKEVHPHPVIMSYHTGGYTGMGEWRTTLWVAMSFSKGIVLACLIQDGPEFKRDVSIRELQDGLKKFGIDLVLPMSVPFFGKQ